MMSQPMDRPYEREFLNTQDALPVPGADQSPSTPRPKVGARFVYPIDGRIVEVDTLIMSADDWAGSPLNGRPDWSSLPLADGSIIAQRLFI